MSNTSLMKWKIVFHVAIVPVCTSPVKERVFAAKYRSSLLGRGGCGHTGAHTAFEWEVLTLFPLPPRGQDLCPQLRKVFLVPKGIMTIAVLSALLHTDGGSTCPHCWQRFPLLFGEAGSNSLSKTGQWAQVSEQEEKWAKKLYFALMPWAWTPRLHVGRCSCWTGRKKHGPRVTFHKVQENESSVCITFHHANKANWATTFSTSRRCLSPFPKRREDIQILLQFWVLQFKVIASTRETESVPQTKQILDYSNTFVLALMKWIVQQLAISLQQVPVLTICLQSQLPFVLPFDYSDCYV